MEGRDLDLALAAGCTNAGKQIDAFRESLIQLTESLALCFTEFNNDHQKVSAMRTKVVHNTQLYRQIHLRASLELITLLRELTTSYTDLSLDEFANYIEDIAEQAAKYKARAEIVQNMHICLQTGVNDLMDEAKIIACSLKREAEKHEVKASQLALKSRSHETSMEKGIMFAGMTGLGCLIAGPFYLTFSQAMAGISMAAAAGGYYAIYHDSEQAVTSSGSKAALKDAENAKLAAEEIAGPIAKCVVTFMNAISEATRFFATINTQLQAFKNEADRAVTKKQKMELDEKLKFHYLKMRKPAARLMKLCDGFCQVAPMIDSELNRICNNDGNHTSFIRNWLEKHEGELTSI